MRRSLILPLLIGASAITSLLAQHQLLSPVSAVDGGPIIFVPVVALLALYLVVYRDLRQMALIAATYFLVGVFSLKVSSFASVGVIFLETMEPLFLLLSLRAVRLQQRDRNIAGLVLFYCISALVCVFAFALIVATSFAFLSASGHERAFEVGVRWMFSHLSAYLTLAPFVMSLFCEAFEELYSGAKAYVRQAAYYLVALAVLIGVATLMPMASASPVLGALAPWVLVLIAPGLVLSAYRLGFLLTAFLQAVAGMSIAATTAFQIGPFAQLSPNILRLILSFGGLSALMMLGYVRILMKALDDAQYAIAAKNRFMASMGHELRSSLTGVVGAAEVLQKELAPGADPHDRLGLIQRTGVLMSRIIEDAVEYSLIGDRGVELEPVGFSLADAARDSAEIFRERLAAKGVSLRVDVDELDEFPLFADRSRIQQVMINLLSNAVKFTDKGEVRLTLKVKPILSDFAACEIEVADTGPGVPETEKRRIFEAFARLNPDGEGGLGLGLAISRDIAHAMEGSLSVFDNKPSGAVFRFKFVARRTGSVADSSIVTAPTPYVRDYSVLVAEDNPANRVILEAMLEAAGLSVTSVENGAEAIDAARNKSYDLILLDMHMPQVGGQAAMVEIRKLENGGGHVPILFVSGDDEPGSRDQLNKLGAADIVTKPFSAERLITAVNNALMKDAGQSAKAIDHDGPSA